MAQAPVPQVIVTPLKAALIHGVAQKVRVLVRVQAPEAPAQTPDAPDTTQPPRRLALVIDRSGSMSGPPLAEAVACARHVVDGLRPMDTVALVVFDNEVQTLMPARPLGDRRAFHRALDAVSAGGTTDLHGGWQRGADALLALDEAGALARVILLSDGNANAGLTDADAIAALCRQAAMRGVSTSTYGLGRHFNEDLMVAMARHGGGNHYYGATAADLFEPFAEEFDLLSRLCARDLGLTLTAPDGVRVTVLNDDLAQPGPDGVFVRLTDLAFGAEAWALVELAVPAAFARGPGAPLLTVSLAARGADGQALLPVSARLALDTMPPAAWEALLEDATVRARADEVEAAGLFRRARRDASRGDWAAVQAMIDTVRRRFPGHDWVQEMTSSLEALAQQTDTMAFSKEALYSSARMTRRLSTADDDGAILALESAKASFLRRKSAQGRSQFVRRPGSDGGAGGQGDPGDRGGR